VATGVSSLDGQMRAACQTLERGPRELEHGPVVPGYRPKLSIKLNCGFVPIEHCPREPRVSTLFREIGQVRQNCASDSSCAVGRLDEKIFQVDTCAADESGESLEIHGESDRFVFDVRENHLGCGTRPKERVAQGVFGGDYLVQKPLIFRKFSNEGQNQWNVLLLSISDTIEAGELLFAVSRI
jgi:hypothetical protein